MANVNVEPSAAASAAPLPHYNSCDIPRTVTHQRGGSYVTHSLCQNIILTLSTTAYWSGANGAFGLIAPDHHPSIRPVLIHVIQMPSSTDPLSGTCPPGDLDGRGAQET